MLPPPPPSHLNAAVAELVRESLANGQATWLVVVSGSMRPLLTEGDEVYVEPIQPHQLHAGDVIVLREPAGLLTHRFYGPTHGRLLTRGDRNLWPDPPASADQLLGRVVARRRNGRLWDWRTPPSQRPLHILWRIVYWESRLLPGHPQSVPSLPQRLIHRMAGFLQGFWCP